MWVKNGTKRTNIRWYFAIAFFIIGVIAYMDRSNISIIAGPMMEDLHLTKTQFGLLASFFSLGYALMQVPSGFWQKSLALKNVNNCARMVECFHDFNWCC